MKRKFKIDIPLGEQIDTVIYRYIPVIVFLILFINFMPFVNGVTLLEYVAARGHSNQILCISSSGPNYCDKNINTAETNQFAGLPDRYTLTGLALIMMGANVNSPSLSKHIGYTPLMFALDQQTGNDDYLAAAMILSGANLNQKADQGLTALMLAVYYHKPVLVKLMLLKGVDINATTAYGQNVLHIAAQTGDTEILKLLIDSGADINARENNGITPLIFAARCDCLSVTEALLKASSDVNARITNSQLGFYHIGETALMVAAENGNDNVLRMLLSAGADPRIEDIHGETALTMAYQHNHKTTMQLITDAYNRPALRLNQTPYTQDKYFSPLTGSR